MRFVRAASLALWSVACTGAVATVPPAPDTPPTPEAKMQVLNDLAALQRVLKLPEGVHGVRYSITAVVQPSRRGPTVPGPTDDRLRAFLQMDDATALHHGGPPIRGAAPLYVPREVAEGLFPDGALPEGADEAVLLPDAKLLHGAPFAKMYGISRAILVPGHGVWLEGISR